VKASAGSPGAAPRRWMTDKPSPQAQADWLRAIYAMAFEKPYLAGVLWYFVVDDPFLPGGGLFPDGASPARPAYQAMADAIAQRTSAAATKTDRQGVVQIEGYAGDYQVEVGEGTAKAGVTVYVTEGRDVSVVGVVDGSTVTVGGVVDGSVVTLGGS